MRGEDLDARTRRCEAWARLQHHHPERKVRGVLRIALLTKKAVELGKAKHLLPKQQKNEGAWWWERKEGKENSRRSQRVVLVLSQLFLSLRHQV